MNIIGRHRESELLKRYLSWRHNSFRPLILSGDAGVGKTTLIQNWLSNEKRDNNIFQFNANSVKSFDELIRIIIDTVKDLHNIFQEVAVIIDDTYLWEENQYQIATDKIYNYKIVKSLVLVSRTKITLKQFESIHIASLNQYDSLEFLKSEYGLELFSKKNIDDIIEMSKGYPLALKLLSNLIQNGGINSINELINSPLYELSNNLYTPSKKIIAEVKPVILRFKMILFHH